MQQRALLQVSHVEQSLFGQLANLPAFYLLEECPQEARKKDQHDARIDELD